jgi:glycosyltransferase involved in cell wall biosynthesis
MSTAASSPGGPTACMIAYANYYTDARIKNYVEALLEQDYRVDVFALGRQTDLPRPGLRVFRVMEKYWGSSSLRYAIALLWFAWLAALLVCWNFLRRRYRLVHVHNLPNFLVFSAVIPKLAGSKVILDVHDPMPESYATKFGLSLDHPLITLLRLEERMSARLANQVITTNELQKEVLCAHGIAADKIEIILNVGNDRLFRPVVNRPSTDQDGLLLVYHGTIAERLGIDLILSALRLASRECPDVRLLLIGEGDYLPTVKTLIRDWALSDRVELVGFVPVEALPPYLARADVGIVGNRVYTEAKQNYMLPVKMLEYAAMEIPTIAPRLRTISRYFDETTALFYTPDDAEDMARRIVDACRHRQLIENVRQHLRGFNQRHNWSVMEKRYLSLVSKYLGTEHS